MFVGPSAAYSFGSLSEPHVCWFSHRPNHTRAHLRLELATLDVGQANWQAFPRLSPLGNTSFATVRMSLLARRCRVLAAGMVIPKHSAAFFMHSPSTSHRMQEGAPASPCPGFEIAPAAHTVLPSRPGDRRASRRDRDARIQDEAHQARR
jgi:hypothetical protein